MEQRRDQALLTYIVSFCVIENLLESSKRVILAYLVLLPDTLCRTPCIREPEKQCQARR